MWAAEVAAAVADAGMTWIEVTLDSDRALEQIATMRAADARLVVGAGSVLTAAAVDEAAAAGAQFVVAPNTDREVIAAGRDRGMAVFPGAATPTEIRAAVVAGATAVKVFPVSALGGPSYISAVLSPLGRPPLVPTGGVTVGDAAAYLAAGAVAVGAGGSLFPSRPDRSQLDTLRDRAASWVEAVR